MTNENSTDPDIPTLHRPLTIENFYELWGWHSTAKHPSVLLLGMAFSIVMIFATTAQRSLMIFMWIGLFLLCIYGMVALTFSWRKFINANCNPDISIMQVIADRNEILRRLEEEAAAKNPSGL